VSYLYRVYGLVLKSQTAIQGLSLISPEDEFLSNNDPISIFVGERPNWLDATLQLPVSLIYTSSAAGAHADATLKLSQLGNQFFRFSYSDGTQFVIDSATKNIWGTCTPPLTQEDLVTYLVGPVLGFALRRRGILALHASIFCSGNQAFALCGGAGAGKSTTAAALALRGIPIQCEDIAALRERDDVCWSSSGYPRVNVWPESPLDVLRTPQALPKITPNWEKQFLPLDGTAFEKQERQLAAVYLLVSRRDEINAPRIEEISSREAVLSLVQNTYMNYLLTAKQREMEFDAITRLVSRTVVRRLVPHSDPAKLALMCDLLETDSAKVARIPTSSIASERP
jgi:hypothetical protein